MLIIGVTGSYGTGKSTVSAMFGDLGAPVIDSDRIVHALLAARGRCSRAIVREFGPGILTAGGDIDRKKLSGRVFKDPRQRKILESIVHPEVIRDIRKQLAGLKKDKNIRAVVLDIPLLFEAGLQELVDMTVVVQATQKEQLLRTASRTVLTRSDRLKRIRAQMPLREKMRQADIIIDNRGPISNTRFQVIQIWEEYVLGAPKNKTKRKH
ncbi:MAG TPA: dephospho-CoA kinase [Candidatus Omnitrophota bacterium]|nr:dephospho-CoA kinase [Candidatus Omnitrophota bacterium]HQO57303.1 dephospho-CoA kinase [Candidatus Omnitrophota bacterium]